MPAVTSFLWALLNVLQALFLGLWTIMWGPVGIVVAAFGRTALALRIPQVTWSPALLKVAGATLEVHGADKVDWSKPCVIVVNHQSMLDIPALQVGLMPAHLRFITKMELMHVPLLGPYMRSVGMIGIDRGNTAEGIKRLKAQAERCHADNVAVVAFAEGTRSRTGQIKPFKKGAFMFALQAGIPIVPVSIEGARRVLPADGFRVRPGAIRIDVGAPIPTAGLTVGDRDALMREAHRAVVAMNLAAGGVGDGSVTIELGGRAINGGRQPVAG
jgi:1-acyl-sn-glycerol-3-phosphate acyltransferase